MTERAPDEINISEELEEILIKETERAQARAIQELIRDMVIDNEILDNGSSLNRPQQETLDVVRRIIEHE